MRIQEAFRLGMKRDIPELLSPMSAGVILNLGPGNSPIAGTKGLGLPKWNADTEPLPFKNGQVTAIYAFHFLEHVANPVAVLRECERVLEIGGFLFVVVPYGSGHMAVQDITHHHFFNEDTWPHMFENNYYVPEGVTDPKPWQLRVHANFIMGVKGTNLALFTQMIKTSGKAPAPNGTE